MLNSPHLSKIHSQSEWVWKNLAENHNFQTKIWDIFLSPFLQKLFLGPCLVPMLVYGWKDFLVKFV